MRDPKAHAKVLELRLQAVRSEWVAATAAHSNKVSRLWGLFNRLIVLTNRHEGATKWTYRLPEGGSPGKWVYTELDTEEGTP